MKTVALLATLLTGALLLYGTKDFAPWADPQSPASTHLSAYYVENAVRETHVPNLVTAVLGDYRGYDTMFETVVIYCAGLAVISVLRRRKS
ncbi:MAG: hydrogen gas-evolving membrane-bound hydrogenase subunit E [Desulfuromonadales bacterium]|nr:hydrogen gas-evolving membrane-bound hydrogenase subunit E [Desulfuromonadales bacterium]MDW7756064.1 hydrogen gas-evolving membrane-bound hydrogenase subunit E [Desulfuromonadales bacterium]